MHTGKVSNIYHFEIFMLIWLKDKMIIFCNIKKYVSETRMHPVAIKTKLVIFSIKIMVKVIDPVPIERVSLVEYSCQIWSLYLLCFKSCDQS